MFITLSNLYYLDFFSVKSKLDTLVIVKQCWSKTGKCVSRLSIASKSSFYWNPNVESQWFYDCGSELVEQNSCSGNHVIKYYNLYYIIKKSETCFALFKTSNPIFTFFSWWITVENIQFQCLQWNTFWSKTYPWNLLTSFEFGSSIFGIWSWLKSSKKNWKAGIYSFSLFLLTFWALLS